MRGNQQNSDGFLLTTQGLAIMQGMLHVQPLNPDNVEGPVITIVHNIMLS